MDETGSDSKHLEEAERQQVRRFEPLRAKGIHEILRKEGRIRTRTRRRGACLDRVCCRPVGGLLVHRAITAAECPTLRGAT